MSVDFLIVPNDSYTEDVAAVAPGTSIITRPCQLWSILVTSDLGTAGIVEFSDDSNGYTAAHRKFKVYFSSGQYSQSVSFPHGLNCTRGLSAQANIASVDVFSSFD